MFKKLRFLFLSLVLLLVLSPSAFATGSWISPQNEPTPVDSFNIYLDGQTYKVSIDLTTTPDSVGTVTNVNGGPTSDSRLPVKGDPVAYWSTTITTGGASFGRSPTNTWYIVPAGATNPLGASPDLSGKVGNLVIQPGSGSAPTTSSGDLDLNGGTLNVFAGGDESCAFAMTGYIDDGTGNGSVNVNSGILSISGGTSGTPNIVGGTAITVGTCGVLISNSAESLTDATSTLNPVFYS